MYQPALKLLIAAAALFVAVGCVENEPAEEPLDPSDFYGEAGHTEVEEPIAFTEQNYDFSGPLTIAELLDKFDRSENVWYGMSPQDGYSQGDERVLDEDCDPEELPFENRVDEIDVLPEFIEGVVTLHPRYFQKVPVCGQDHRYYGSFYLQDETGGILVLKDSRIADFTFGHRVRLRVRGVVKYFDSLAVLAYDQQEVVDYDATHPIFYSRVYRTPESAHFGPETRRSETRRRDTLPARLRERPLGDEDIGKVRRVTGTVVSEPTNNNFNELRLMNEEGVTYVVGIDRELGLRGVDLYEGQRVQITGPVELSFGDYRVVVASLGQIEWLDEAPEDR